MSLAIIPRQLTTDQNGQPRVGAIWKFYQAGTDTLIQTYTTATFSANHPLAGVPSGSDGTFPAVYVNGVTYPTHKEKIVDADGVTVWTEDNMPTGDAATLRADLANPAAGFGSDLVAIHITAAETAASVTPTNYAYPPGNVLRYGADPTGVADCTTAFQNAINAGANSLGNNKTVFVPNGSYRFDGTLTCHQGTMIRCEGSQGSTVGYGTSFQHYSTADFLVWDGNGTSAKGTGGGLENCLITKQDTYEGGRAIYILGTDDNHRPGEMLFTNVLIYGVGSTANTHGGDGGLWSEGIVINGTANNTPGTRGVRSINMRKVRVAGVYTAGHSLVINQVTHFFAYGFDADTGNTSAVCGITLQGINAEVFFSDADVSGTLTIVANDATNTTNAFSYSGFLGSTFTNNDTQVNGVVNAALPQTGGLVLVNKSTDLKCQTNLNPSGLWTNGANITNVTGDATNYSVVWDTEKFDEGNNAAPSFVNYNVSCAGIYAVTFGVCLTGVAAAHIRSDISVVQGGSVTRTATSVKNPGLDFVAGGVVSDTVTTLFKCAYADTIKCTAVVSGGTKIVGIVGNASTDYSWFSVKYLGV